MELWEVQTTSHLHCEFMVPQRTALTRSTIAWNIGMLHDVETWWFVEVALDCKPKPKPKPIFVWFRLNGVENAHAETNMKGCFVDYLQLKNNNLSSYCWMSIFIWVFCLFPFAYCKNECFLGKEGFARIPDANIQILKNTVRREERWNAKISNHLDS